ncbi:MAG: 3-dehydroquinate synthase [Deltaproteobacteria bacterium]|nr:3-dehydroquinate synthase [Deltaproteobacteria bacterium]
MSRKLIAQRDLPNLRSCASRSILIFDRKLVSVSPAFRQWVRTFPKRYPVSAGEKLKAVESFPNHMKRLLALSDGIARNDIIIIAVGGGSVCDFAGFVASVLKRGVQLIFVPSTWLAAVDAAHGGKTALNVRGIKNQIGTFYFPSHIYLVKSLLMAQPEARAREAMAELTKIALISGGPLRANPERVTNSIVTREEFRAGRPSISLWKLLPHAIRAKQRIVQRDPFERNGHRRLLNLGHTMGHIVEAHYRMSHGKAIAAGLLFALEWSAKKYGLPQHVVDTVRNGQKKPSRKMSRQRFQTLVSADKKRISHDAIEFVFLKGVGRPHRERVSLRALVAEAQRQGWVA